jgi:hypothetical protein
MFNSLALRGPPPIVSHIPAGPNQIRYPTNNSVVNEMISFFEFSVKQGRCQVEVLKIININSAVVTKVMCFSIYVLSLFQVWRVIELI